MKARTSKWPSCLDRRPWPPALGWSILSLSLDDVCSRTEYGSCPQAYSLLHLTSISSPQGKFPTSHAGWPRVRPQPGASLRGILMSRSSHIPATTKMTVACAQTPSPMQKQRKRRAAGQHRRLPRPLWVSLQLQPRLPRHLLQHAHHCLDGLTHSLWKSNSAILGG